MKKHEHSPRYWLMKSEPDAFSVSDLKAKGEATWDGVRNFQVRNMMRDLMAVEDRALFYHSSCKDVGVVGEMEIIRAAFPDPTQFDEKSEYYDAKSKADSPQWLAVEVRYVATFPRLVTLAELRADPSLSGLRILERGNRLSITEVSKKDFERIVKLAHKRQVI